jgi:hypothetical protein
MANQHNSIWTPAAAAEMIRLREDEGLDWASVNAELGLPVGSKSAKDKYRRIVADREQYDALRSIIEASVEDSSFGETLIGSLEEALEHSQAEDEAGDDEEFRVSEQVTAQDYEYDEAARVYRFPVLGKLISVPEEDWNKVLLMYSGDGANLTQHEIAVTLGISKKQLEAMIRAYGHFKARPPVSREALARGENMEDLAGQAIEVRERRFIKVLREQNVRNLTSEVRRLRQEIHARGETAAEMKLLVEEAFERMGGFAAREVRKYGPRIGRRFDVHAPVFDAHIGLTSFKEAGYTNDFNADIALEYIRRHGALTAQRIQERPGHCETAYLTHGGDTFHAPFGKTEHGRHLQRDKTDRILFHQGLEAFVDQIESVRPFVDRVVIGGVEGNHGHLIDVLLVDFLGMYYRNSPDVLVQKDLRKRTHFRVRDSLHVLDHGTTFHSVGSEAALGRADRISRLVSGADYHGAKRIYFYVGHMHHREHKSQAHMDVIRVPTMCHENEYEEFLGFYNDPQCDVYVLNERGMIEATERLYLLDGTPVESRLSA